MAAILTGIIAAIAIAIGAGYFLTHDPEPAWQAYSTTSVRVGDPGSNLVGRQWSGENTAVGKSPGG